MVKKLSGKKNAKRKKGRRCPFTEKDKAGTRGRELAPITRAGQAKKGRLAKKRRLDGGGVP